MGDSRPGPRFVVPMQGGRPAAVPHPGAPSARPPATPTEPPGDLRFRVIFEQAPLGVGLTDAEGLFVEVNQRLRELLAELGIDPATGGLDDLGRHLPEAGETLRRWREELGEVLAGRRPVALAELALPADGPAGTAPRRLQVTTALVVLGGRRCLLSHLADSTGHERLGPRATDQRPA